MGGLKIKKLVSLLMILCILTSTSACSKKHEPVKPDKDVKKVVQDKNYTKDLKKEKKVLDGQVYIQNNMVIVTMVIKDEVKKEDAKALADKYAKILKQTYKDMPVNVQAVQKGEASLISGGSFFIYKKEIRFT